MRTTQSSSSGFTFSLMTLGTVALIVACSSNNKVRVTQQGTGSGDGESKVMACSDSLHASTQQKVSNKTVVICDNAEGAKATAKSVPTEHSVSYSVGKDDGGKGSHGKVHLIETIGFSTTEDLTKDQQTDLSGKFDDVCGADARTLFGRTKVEKTPIDLVLKFVFSDGDGDVFGNPNESVDQVLRIVKGTDGDDTYWSLDQVPSRPRFYPKGKVADYKACLTQYPTQGKDQTACIWQKRHDLNVSACAAFVKRVGNSLGIVDAETEANTCGATQPKLLDATPTPTATPATETTADAKPQSKPTPTQPGSDGSSSFAKPRYGNDGDFLKKAELNRKDVVSILKPVCPETLKDQK